MDIDSLKKSWHEMTAELDRVETLDRKLAEELAADKAVAVTTRIKRRFVILSACCFASVLLAVPVKDVLGADNFFTVCFILYFVVLGLLNIILFHKVSKIRLDTMTMCEALKKAVSLQIARYRFKQCSYVLMIPMVCSMLYMLYAENITLFVAGIIGALAGCFLGFRLDRNIERHIRHLKEVLGEELICLFILIPVLI